VSTALHRTTKQYVESADTPAFPTATWILNSAQANALWAANVPTKYWNIVGDAVTEMSPAEKAAVDASLLSSSRDKSVTELDQVENILRAFVLVLMDELNLHAATVTAILNAIDGAASLADVKTSVGAIADLPQRTNGQLKTSIRNKLGT